MKLATKNNLIITFILSIFMITSSFSATKASSTSTNSKQVTPVGTWMTIDDVTDSPRSIVVIKEKDGQLSGTIKKIFYRKGEGPSDVCTKCSGTRQDQKFLGMQIMWDMKQVSPDTWLGGRVLDPESGKEYKCKLTIEPGNDKLNVRGYIGVTLLGRTQTWVRQ